jgi:hypothetical protein
MILRLRSRDLLLKILGNSQSSLKVSEIVELGFIMNSSDGTRYVSAMSFDLRTLPTNHPIHPNNNSPIYSSINHTNARTPTKMPIHVPGTIEEFIPWLISEIHRLDEMGNNNSGNNTNNTSSNTNNTRSNTNNTSSNTSNTNQMSISSLLNNQYNPMSISSMVTWPSSSNTSSGNNPGNSGSASTSQATGGEAPTRSNTNSS